MHMNILYMNVPSTCTTYMHMHTKMHICHFLRKAEVRREVRRYIHVTKQQATKIILYLIFVLLLL